MCACAPLIVSWRYVIRGYLIGAECAFDLPYTYFIVGICGLFNAHDVRVVGCGVISRDIANLSVGINPCAHVDTLGIGREHMQNLREVAFKVNRVVAGVGFGVVNQGIVATRRGVAGVVVIGE